MGMTHYEMKEEATRLASLYLTKDKQFWTTLFQTLERENPRLAIMVAIKMAPVLLQERVQEQDAEELKVLRLQVKDLGHQLGAMRTRLRIYEWSQTILLVLLTISVLACLGT